MFIYVDKNGCVFEKRSYREPGKKYPTAETKCIGKKDEDGVFHPNPYFVERTARENLEKELAEVKEKLQNLKKETKKEKKEEKKTEEVVSEAVSSRKKEGATYAIEKIAEKIGIAEALKETLGEENVNEALATVSYMVITKCEPVDNFSFFSESHAYAYGRDISSSEFSRFFASIEEENVNTFYKVLDKNRPVSRDSVFCSFDSTAISSYSDDLSDVEVSKGKQDPELKHFSIAAVHSSLTGSCAYYRLYRGNIPDSKTISNFVSVTKAMGYSFKRMILDRGYGGVENIHLIHKVLKAELIVMLTCNYNLYGEAIEKAKKEHFETDAEHYVSGQDVYGITISCDFNYKYDKKDESMFVYVHVYFSQYRQADETRKLHDALDDKITELNLAFEKGKITVEDAVARKFTALNKKCIKVVRTSNTTVRFEKDIQAVNEKLSKAGYFCILSTEKDDYRNTLYTYRSRDGVEEFFDVVKNDIGFDRAHVKNDDTLQGKVFCVMIASMIASYIRAKMREGRAAGLINSKLTYKKLIHELECIYSYKMGKKVKWSEISERQKTIFKILEIEPPVKQPATAITKTKLKKPI